MTKEELLEKIKHSHNSVQLRAWIESLPVGHVKIKPIRLKVGDVFMHQGFQHPIILTKRSKGKWIGILLTTESKCEDIMEQCISRFFHNSYFTSNIIIMNNLSVKDYIGVYDNTPHLKKVFNKIKMIIQ